jgi:hypothetical protein
MLTVVVPYYTFTLASIEAQVNAHYGGTIVYIYLSLN